MMRQRNGSCAVAADRRLPESPFMPLKIPCALLILAILLPLNGCLAMEKGSAFVRSLYSSTGVRRIAVGEIGITATAAFSGTLADDTLEVSADELGNAILSGGKGTLVMTPLALGDPDRKEAIELLRNLAVCGEAAQRERVEVTRYVGAFSSDRGVLDGSAVIGIDCISSAGGKAWAGKMSICYRDPRYFSAQKTDGAGRCDMEIDVYLNPEAARTLISLLEKVPHASATIKNPRSKDGATR